MTDQTKRIEELEARVAQLEEWLRHVTTFSYRKAGELHALDASVLNLLSFARMHAVLGGTLRGEMERHEAIIVGSPVTDAYLEGFQEVRERMLAHQEAGQELQKATDNLPFLKPWPPAPDVALPIGEDQQ